jgi:hypothetical protein
VQRDGPFTSNFGLQAHLDVARLHDCSYDRCGRV